jgi:hypothetical protein
MQITVTDSNVDAVLDALPEAIERALEALGLQCEGYAQLGCPVDTGLLRNSIVHAVSGQTTSLRSYHADKPNKDGTYKFGGYAGAVGTRGEAAVYIGTNVEYAPYVEYGEYNHKVGQAHFLEHALNDHTDEYKRLAEEMLKNA